MINVRCLKIGAFTFAMFSMVLFPVELFHALVWIIKHIYLFAQFIISSVVINLFETSRRTTDYLIAYTLIVVALILMIRFFFLIKAKLQRIHESLSAFDEHKTCKLKNSFKNMPGTKRLKWLFLSMNMVLVATNV